MCAQGFDRTVTAREFGFGQRGVNFFVADLVQQNGGSSLATFEFWDQMVHAAAPFRDRAVAKRADRIGCQHGMAESRRPKHMTRGQ